MPERHRFSEEHGTKFWDSYFTHLFKISWPDFVEAFEHFYLLGRCPVDLVCQLRLRMDTTLGHQVSRSSWQQLLQDCSRIWDIVDMLLAEVLGDIAPRIYRPRPLGCPGRPAPQPCDEELASTGLPGSAASAASATILGAWPPPASPHQPQPPGSSAAPKPKPWFPFAHSTTEDGDMAIPTPNDLRLRQDSPEQPHPGGGSQQPTVAWDDFVARLCVQHRPWWDGLSDVARGGPGAPAALSLQEGAAGEEPSRVAALRAVSSGVACTRRALVFRVVSGDLAQGKPVLELPRRGLAAPVEREDGSEAPLLPALVVTANGTRFSGVTKFGRSSSRRALLPDCPMSEPIASRSHFNVVYEQDADRYYLMDAGSKWGTFVKIASSVTLGCGDWIRVGGVEFIIRYCGGGCACHKRHAHYRLHSLRLLREHQGGGKGAAHPRMPARATQPPASGSRSWPTPGPLLGPGLPRPHGPRRPTSSAAATAAPAGRARSHDADAGSSSEDDWSLQLQDELLLLLSSRRPRGWATTSARLCQQSALLQGVGGPARAADSTLAARPLEGLGQGQAGLARPPVPPAHWWRRLCAEGLPTMTAPAAAQPQATLVPIAPLELDFISGPRMGEKLVLCERVCTLGRGEGNTIQVSDSQLASVSRVHCIFEYSGNRWHMRDNGSTNGTWRRLSCVLEPSQPIPISDGMSIQAGVHEFLVEEADMKHWWIPSAAFSSFEELCEQERREQQEEELRCGAEGAAPTGSEGGP